MPALDLALSLRVIRCAACVVLSLVFHHVQRGRSDDGKISGQIYPKVLGKIIQSQVLEGTGYNNTGGVDDDVEAP